MIYGWILLIFGLAPLLLLWLLQPHLVRRYAGSLLVIVILILLVGIPWEMFSVNAIWYYSPDAVWGPRLVNLPVEELAFFMIDALLVGTLALYLDPDAKS
jgi:15-cis-phytoene synthase/lycopene beta-cyclase